MAEEIKDNTPIEEQEQNQQAQEEQAEATEATALEEEKKEETSDKKKKKFGFKSKESKEEELQKKLDETNDKYLRLYSEFDNFRKRTIKEKGDLIKTAGEGVLKDILPVYEDLSRALQASEKQEDNSLKEGLTLIYNKFSKVLEQKGIQEIKCMGETFDVDHHEALTQIPAPSEDQKGKILDVIEKGYKLHDKIIRFPKVVVGN